MRTLIKKISDIYTKINATYSVSFKKRKELVILFF